MRPGQKEQHKADQCPDGQAYHPRGVLDQRLAHFGEWRAAELVAVAEVAPQGLMQAAFRYLIRH
ncbi:hypothetical protein D3C78_1793000 [compost metagenome]